MKCLVLVLWMMAGPALGQPLVPDAALTPGAWKVPATSLKVLCIPGYTRTVRNVPLARRNGVFLAYGIDPADASAYEMDHLVPLELDGTNDAGNLWPQSYVTQPLNARRKDVLENKLKRMVCAAEISLGEAQKAIATDWVGAYRKYVGS